MKWGRSKEEFKEASLDEARFYLIGDRIVFKMLPVEVYGEGWIVKAEWKFAEIGQDIHTFFSFLREARWLGANEDAIIRIVAESALDKIIPDVLKKLGIYNKRIVYTVDTPDQLSWSVKNTT